MKIRASIAAPIALFVMLIIAAAWMTHQELHQHIVEIRTWIEAQGLWGAIAFIIAFVFLTSAFAPDSLMAIAAGAIFGFAEGLAILLIAAPLAMSFQYILARRVFRRRLCDYIEHKPRLRRIDSAIHQHQLRLQLLIRLTPMSPALVSYLVGAIAVRFTTALAAMISNVPAFLVQLYLGVEGAHVVEVAARPKGEIVLEDVLKICGLFISIVALIIISRFALKAVNEEARAQPNQTPAPA